MNSQQLTHNFFYQTEKTRGSYANLSVSFSADTFYSYYTAIGKIVKNKLGEDILLISNDSLSSTTSKHTSCLRQSCPFDSEHIIYIPQSYGNHYMNIDSIIELCKKRIKYYSIDDMKKVSNRENFKFLYNCLNQINEKVADVVLDTKFKNQIDVIYKFIIDKEAADKVKKEQRQKEQAEKQRLENEKLLNNPDLLEFEKNYTFSECCQLAFYYAYSEKSEALKEIISKYNDNERLMEVSKGLKLKYTQNNYNVVWCQDDFIKTSLGVTVPKSEAVRLLKLYQKKLLKIGDKVDNKYRIIKLDDDIKIGCHLISKHNIEELLKEISC